MVNKMDMELMGAVIRIIIVLPLVTALAYFLIKYGLARRTLAPGGRRRMRLIEQMPIGPKTSLSLVEIGGRYILMAHSDNGFHVISEMDELPATVLQQEPEIIDYKDLVDRLKKTVGSNRILTKYLARKGKT